MKYLKYFAYGSNLHPERLRDRGVHYLFVRVEELTGWELNFQKKSSLKKSESGKCNIKYTKNPQDVVWGVVYKIKKCDLPKLDCAEGKGKGYDRKDDFKLPSTGENVITYLADKDHIKKGLKPFAWYQNMVVEGARYHQSNRAFPHEYIDAIKAHPSQSNIDAECEERILEKMKSINKRRK